MPGKHADDVGSWMLAAGGWRGTGGIGSEIGQNGDPTFDETMTHHDASIPHPHAPRPVQTYQTHPFLSTIADLQNSKEQPKEKSGTRGHKGEGKGKLRYFDGAGN